MCDCAGPVGMWPTILRSLGVDDGDGLVEFGGDVEQVGRGRKREGAAHAVAEVEVADDLARGQIDDEHLVAVDARLAHAELP